MANEKMTLEDIRRFEREYLTPVQVAPLLGLDPQYIRIQARTDADKLGFPVTVCGTRIKIPRRAFLRFMEGGGEQ